jgi:hypothetical protein
MLEGAGILGLFYLLVMLVVLVVKLALWVVLLPFKLIRITWRASRRSSARRSALQRQRVNQWTTTPGKPHTTTYDLSGTATLETSTPPPPKHESNLWPPPMSGDPSF